jgi:hypothetical protein
LNPSALKRILFLISFTLISCQPSKNRKLGMDILSIDTTSIALFPYDSTDHWTPFRNAKQAELSRDEARLIDTIFFKEINYYNQRLRKETSVSDSILKYNQIDINHRLYKRQYIVVISESGDKEVWINCFCSHEKDWRTRIIDGLGGGSCFFMLTINLTKKTCDRFYVNAPM